MSLIYVLLKKKDTGDIYFDCKLQNKIFYLVIKITFLVK